MERNKLLHIKILTGISVAAILFHTLILLKIVPYEMVWGGKLKTDAEMYLFEILSIVINAFFILVLLQKAPFIKSFLAKKSISIILWIFFALFVLNTIGNVFSKTTFEKSLTLLTLLNCILLWKINRPTIR